MGDNEKREFKRVGLYDLARVHEANRAAQRQRHLDAERQQNTFAPAINPSPHPWGASIGNFVERTEQWRLHQQDELDALRARKDAAEWDADRQWSFQPTVHSTPVRDEGQGRINDDATTKFLQRMAKGRVIHEEKALLQLRSSAGRNPTTAPRAAGVPRQRERKPVGGEIVASLSRKGAGFFTEPSPIRDRESATATQSGETQMAATTPILSRPNSQRRRRRRVRRAVTFKEPLELDGEAEDLLDGGNEEGDELFAAPAAVERFEMAVQTDPMTPPRAEMSPLDQSRESLDASMVALLGERLAESQAELADCRMQLEKLQKSQVASEIAELKARLNRENEGRTADHKEMTIRLKEATTEIDMLRRHVAAEIADKDAARRDVHRLERELATVPIRTAQDEIVHRQNRESQAMVKAMEQSLSESRREAADLRWRVSDLMREKQSNKNIHGAEVLRLNQEMSKLRESRDKTANELAAARAELAALQNEHATGISTHVDIVKLKEQIVERDLLASTQERALSELRTEHDEARRTLEDADNEFDSIERELEGTKQQAEEAAERADALEAENKKLAAEVARLQAQGGGKVESSSFEKSQTELRLAHSLLAAAQKSLEVERALRDDLYAERAVLKSQLAMRAAGQPSAPLQAPRNEADAWRRMETQSWAGTALPSASHAVPYAVPYAAAPMRTASVARSSVPGHESPRYGRPGAHSRTSSASSASIAQLVAGADPLLGLSVSDSD